MTSLNCNGFINYFGTQRFGNISLSTPHIGHVKDLKWKLVYETPPPTTSLSETQSSISLNLEFSLNPSRYVTTALVEILLL